MRWTKCCFDHHRCWYGCCSPTLIILWSRIILREQLTRKAIARIVIITPNTMSTILIWSDSSLCPFCKMKWKLLIYSVNVLILTGHLSCSSLLNLQFSNPLHSKSFFIQFWSSQSNSSSRQFSIKVVHARGGGLKKVQAYVRGIKEGVKYVINIIQYVGKKAMSDEKFNELLPFWFAFSRMAVYRIAKVELIADAST